MRPRAPSIKATMDPVELLRESCSGCLVTVTLSGADDLVMVTGAVTTAVAVVVTVVGAVTTAVAVVVTVVGSERTGAVFVVVTVTVVVLTGSVTIGVAVVVGISIVVGVSVVDVAGNVSVVGGSESRPGLEGSSTHSCGRKVTSCSAFDPSGNRAERVRMPSPM